MQNKLPGDPSSLILGIIGLVIGVAGCCCYGVTAIIPLALSIWGFVMANKSMRLYRLNPEEYSESSKSNVSIGRVLNILSIIFNGIVFLIILGAFLVVGVAGIEEFGDEFKEGFNSGSTNDWDYEVDDFSDTEDVYDLDEVDSISTDSIFLQEVYPEGDSIE